MEVVGSLSAITTIAGLTYKVYKSLNSLVHDLATAPDYLISLRSQVLTFALALRHLKRYLRAAGQSLALPESSIQELLEAIRGGEIIIKQLDKQLSGIRVEEVRTKNGEVVLKAPAWDRLQSKLDEGRITKWSNSLSAHCGPLNLLLKVQELDHSFAWARSLEDSDDELLIPTPNTEAASQDISQLDNDEEAVPTEELKRLGESYEPSHPQNVAEGGRPEKESSFGSFLKRNAGKFQQKVRDGSIDLRQQYRRVLSTQSKEFKWQLRVVVLGRGGAGKSKLSSSVCGLPYLDDGFDGKKTPPDQIWKRMNPIEQKRKLELHDSGGLEGPKTTQAIHAIWYMIPCCDPFRAVQETDELFLAGELVDTGEIPIFVVFTQYDLLMDNYVRPNAGTGATEESIKLLTHQLFKDKIESKAMAAVKDKSKISFCRVGLRKDGSEYLSTDDGGPPFGTEYLVKQMQSRLENGYLQIQWVAIQQKDDRAKLYDSISMSVALLWTARRLAKSSYLPAICLIGLGSIYSSILNIAGRFWEIDDWRESMSTKVLRAIFNLSKPDLFFSELGLLYNVAGNLSVTLISRITLQMIVGVNLLGRRLFRLRDANKPHSLTREQIEAEIQDFQDSNDRKRMADKITLARMGQINYKQKERVDEVIKVAKEALEASVGYVDSSFFTEERMRVMKELSVVDTSQESIENK